MAIANLDYKKPVTTRRGSQVHVYMVYKDYMNGAWYEEKEDRWVPCQWTLSGFFLPQFNDKQLTSSLDLINNDYYQPEEAA